MIWSLIYSRGRRGRDRMVVGFTSTCPISAYYNNGCEFEPRWWRGVLDTTLWNKVCQWFAGGRWFSPGTSVPSTNKTEPPRYSWNIVESGVTHHKPTINVSFEWVFRSVIPSSKSICIQRCMLIVLEIIIQWKRRGGISHFSNTNPL